MRPRYSLSIFALLVLIGSLPAGSQPSPDGAGLLAAWRSGWDQGLQSVQSVSYIETISRTIEGPRERSQFSAMAEVHFSSGTGIDRNVRRVEYNGQRVPTVRMNAMNRRMRRAYGAGFDWVNINPLMAVRLAEIVRPTGSMVADNVGDVQAWRVTTAPGRANDRIERVVYWFAQAEDRPRLLRVRIDGRVPSIPGRVQGGSAVVTTYYIRRGGLDLPRRAQAEVIIRQVRRRQIFTVLMNAEATYSAATVSPR